MMHSSRMITSKAKQELKIQTVLWIDGPGHIRFCIFFVFLVLALLLWRAPPDDLNKILKLNETYLKLKFVVALWVIGKGN